jgi:hypothetical protein
MNTDIAASPNLDDLNRIQVFVSHKIGDEAIARKVVAQIEMFSGDIVFHFSEEAPFGDTFPEWIKQNLRHSHLLLLLYTDPEENWEWCLYETGLYTPLNEEEFGRIICIYNPESGPPKPLLLVQGVEATAHRLKGFLKQLLTTTELTGAAKPLRTNIPEEALDTAARTIAQLIGPSRRETKRHNPTLVIRIPKDAEVVDGKIPQDATVESHRGALELFGIDTEKLTWSGLRQTILPRQGIFWLDEISRAICEVCQGKVPQPTVSTFRETGGGKIYRPILLRTEYRAEKPVAFYIGLIREYAPEAWGIKDGSGHLYQLIRLGIRFRWEVMEHFIEQAIGISSDEGKRTYCRQMIESLQVIEEEANIRGYLDEDFVIDAFKEGANKDLVRTLFGTWKKLRTDIVEAAEQLDVEEVRTELIGLRDLNNQFLAIATREYASYF